MNGKTIWLAVTALTILLSVNTSVADDAFASFKTVPCTIITQIFWAVYYVGPTLILIMMLYAAAKYAFSADDPGGRKQAKSIFIHAIIAGILFLIVWAVHSVLKENITWLDWDKLCWS